MVANTLIPPPSQVDAVAVAIMADGTACEKLLRGYAETRVDAFYKGRPALSDSPTRAAREKRIEAQMKISRPHMADAARAAAKGLMEKAYAGATAQARATVAQEFRRDLANAQHAPVPAVAPDAALRAQAVQEAARARLGLDGLALEQFVTNRVAVLKQLRK